MGLSLRPNTPKFVPVAAVAKPKTPYPDVLALSKPAAVGSAGGGGGLAEDAAARPCWRSRRTPPKVVPLLALAEAPDATPGRAGALELPAKGGAGGGGGKADDAAPVDAGAFATDARGAAAGAGAQAVDGHGQEARRRVLGADDVGVARAAEGQRHVGTQSANRAFGAAVSGWRGVRMTKPVALAQSRPVSARTSISRKRCCPVNWAPKSSDTVKRPSVTLTLSMQRSSPTGRAAERTSYSRKRRS